MLLVGILSMLALLVVIYRKHDRPISAPNDDKNRWYIWLTAGATCFAIGFITLAVDNDGGELSSVGWSIWMVSWALGLVLVIFALLLAGSTFLSRRELHRSQT